MVIRWFKFVRYKDVEAHEALGRRVSFDLGPTHGQWSVGMEWFGTGEPVKEPTHVQA